MQVSSTKESAPESAPDAKTEIVARTKKELAELRRQIETSGHAG